MPPVHTTCMARQIALGILRNECGKILDAVERGETFVVTRYGRTIGELRPIGRPHFVRTEVLIEALKGAPRIDYRRFRQDLDRLVDQDPTPRA